MITLKQLAKELKVSISTVSKALNNSEEISKETIKRVKKLAEEYNYKPNKVALSLKNSRTRTIGVIIPSILNPFFARVLYGIEKEASKQGYQIITCMSNESLEKERNSIQLLANGSVDGFILAASEETQIQNSIEHLNNSIKQGLPVVMFDRVANDLQCDKIIIDDYNAACNATNKLLSKKRKNIALFTTINNLSVGKLRVNGYKKALFDANIKFNESLILKINKEEEAYPEILNFIKSNKIDGIVAVDNSSGIMAINIATDLGIKVPEDIAVIGFSNEMLSNYSSPKLTSIDQNSEEIGKMTVNLLVDRLENKLSKNNFKTRVIPASITERGSS